MPESGDKIPPEILKEQSAKYAQRVRTLSIIFLYSSGGMAIGMVGGIAFALLTNVRDDLPVKIATAGAGIGALAGAIRSRFR